MEIQLMINPANSFYFVLAFIEFDISNYQYLLEIVLFSQYNILLHNNTYVKQK